MQLESLKVTNFRNIRSTVIRPSEGVNVFFGDNGSGKTNLLEAIFCLCLGRSQRGARDIMMVGDGREREDSAEPHDFFHLEGIGRVGGGEVRLSCAYQKGGRKKITIDDNPARVSRLFQHFSLISIAPEDVALFTGGPSLRRRFMDLHLSQASETYLANLTDYNKSLAQKNSFLKNNPGQECPFDPLLVQFGSKIMASRQRYIHFLKAMAPGYYGQISGTDVKPEWPDFQFDYKPNVPFEKIDEISEVFQQKLNASRRKEEILETAVVGPHRDDIDFNICGFPARGYGSQGELRSAAVGMMMGAANFLESRREEKPILLLDEIFAELDDKRRENLARLFSSFEQLFLTTAVNPPNGLLKNSRMYRIQQGEIVQE
ncbi:MAG: DNA replication/repair protein RecF [FCB group bacterium]|nr:DNA replication/repair protein RecF [FCB group bacterium]